MKQRLILYPTIVALLAGVWFLGTGSQATVPDRADIEHIADFDPLENISGVPEALAVVEGTVNEWQGPAVELRPDGFTEWESNRNGEDDLLFPVVQVSGRLTANLNRGPQFVNAVNDIRAIARNGELSLTYTKGYFEPETRYAFFVGWWDEGSYSIVYAHDIKADRPAPGFLNEQTIDVLDELKALVQRADRGNNMDNLEVLTHVATEYDTDEILALTAPASVVDEIETYPVFADDVEQSEIASLTPIEIMILVPEGNRSSFAVKNQGKGKTLGWFETNDQGAVTIRGFIDYTDSLQLLSKGGPGEAAKAFPLASFGVKGDKLALPAIENGDTIYGVVDLSGPKKDSAQLLITTSFDEYDLQVNQLSSQLDASTPRPQEPSNDDGG